MEKADQNGDVEGDASVQGLVETEEAGDFSEEVKEELKRVKEAAGTAREKAQREAIALESEEEFSVSQQEISRASELEEEASEDHVNGKPVEAESGLETEELISERHNLDFSEETQGTEEVIEVVEETEIVEEQQETLEELTQGSDDEIVSEREIAGIQEEEEEEVKVPEKKKIQYVEEDVEDLDFSDGPDTQEPETEEDSAAVEILEKKQDAEVVLEEAEVQEEREEEVPVPEEQPEVEEELVDGKQKTKEPVQSVKKEEVKPTKPVKKTKEHTKEEAAKEPEGLQRRRSSTENFQKLKDRFSNGTKVEENNKKNAEGETKTDKQRENEKARGASNMSDAKSKRFGGTSEKCTQCNRTVYPMEKMEVAGRLLHKTCFKCCKCNSQLSVGRFSIGGKDMYCMTHYKQAFREKGTYDVFTPDNPIKGKWENK